MNRGCHRRRLEEVRLVRQGGRAGSGARRACERSAGYRTGPGPRGHGACLLINEQLVGWDEVEFHDTHSAECRSAVSSSLRLMADRLSIGGRRPPRLAAPHLKEGSGSPVPRAARWRRVSAHRIEPARRDPCRRHRDRARGIRRNESRRSVPRHGESTDFPSTSTASMRTMREGLAGAANIGPI